jgi:hypothetical protein
MARSSFAIGVLLLAGLTLGADEPAGAPKEVQQAEKTLTKWLGAMKGKALKDVRKSMGVPTNETTWTYEKSEQPLLKYKIGEAGMLSLYFFKEQVVAVKFSIAPE